MASGGYYELLYTNKNFGTAKATFTTEIRINDTAGMGVQYCLPPHYFPPTPDSEGKKIRIEARGVLSSTATPTFTITIRGGVADSITSAILLGSAAMITTTTVTNAPWSLQGDVELLTIGGAGANSTIRGIGEFICPGVAAVSPPASIYQRLWGGGATPGTAATFDTSIANFINFNAACSASNAANSITLQQLVVTGLN